MNEVGLDWFFKEQAAKSVDGAFSSFLENNINISGQIRTNASKSHNHLRDFLSEENGRDATFPVTLSIFDRDFLGGSFARHTKVWPLDDIDIYIPLDGSQLVYYEWGIAQPITVLSDYGGFLQNPLLGYRWLRGQYISSERVIAGFAKVLDRHYPQATKIKENGQAVTVRMTYGANDESDGLGFDVVPCFSMKPNNGERPFYLIPSGTDGWIRTNPRVDNDVVDRLNEKHKTFRKAVKLIKYWNQYKMNGAFNSYYVELAIAREYIRKNQTGNIVSPVSFAVALGFWAFNEAARKGNQDSFIAKAPAVEPGTTDFTKTARLSAVSGRATEAWNYELEGDSDRAIRKWQSIFGDNFGS